MRGMLRCCKVTASASQPPVGAVATPVAAVMPGWKLPGDRSVRGTPGNSKRSPGNRRQCSVAAEPEDSHFPRVSQGIRRNGKGGPAADAGSRLDQPPRSQRSQQARVPTREAPDRVTED